MEKKLTLEVTQIKECEDCTSEFFVEGEFPTDNYAIVKISSKSYGVAERKSGKCSLFFRKITPMNGFFLVQIKNGEEVLVDLSNIEMESSDIFKKLIKMFKIFALVEDLSGKRQLFNLVDFCFYKYNINKENEAIIRLPNEKLTVINQDLKYSNTEFDDFKCNGDYVVATFNDEEKRAIIRVSDLKESKHFSSIELISNEYALCRDDESNEYVMRLSDFAITTAIWQS